MEFSLCLYQKGNISTRALTYQAQSAENGFLRLVSILQLFVLSQLAFLICPEGSVEMCAHHPSYTIT